MKRCIVLMCLLLCPTFTGATTYKWVDEKGTVGFADDLGHVPKRYRSHAVIVDNGAQPVEVTETAAPASGKEAGDKAGATAKQEKAKPVYGDKNEDAWRKEFGKLKADIKANEEHLETLKARLADTGKMSRGEYLSLQNTVKNTEARITTLRQKLDDLQSAADKAGVPNDLR